MAVVGSIGPVLLYRNGLGVTIVTGRDTVLARARREQRVVGLGLLPPQQHCARNGPRRGRGVISNRNDATHTHCAFPSTDISSGDSTGSDSDGTSSPDSPSRRDTCSRSERRNRSICSVMRLVLATLLEHEFAGDIAGCCALRRPLRCQSNNLVDDELSTLRKSARKCR